MKRLVRFASLAMLALTLTAIWRPVSAHESVTVGIYTVEIGWVDEPAVVGQRNAVVVNVSSSDGSIKPEDIDVKELKVAVVYGSESKMLELQPLGEDTPGQYIAPILPTRAGQFTVKLSGKLGGDGASAEVQPEEVVNPDSIHFPAVEATSRQGGLSFSDGLAGAGVLFGLAGLGLALTALRRARS